MSKLIISEDDQLTREEYLKKKSMKKKPTFRFKKRYAVIFIIFLLTLYIGMQVYNYNKYNNYKFNVTGEAKHQKSYEIIFTNESYTYNPNIALHHILSTGYEDKKLMADFNIKNIDSVNGYVYGVKEDKKLYRYSTLKKDLELIYDAPIDNYLVYNYEIYVLVKGKITRVDTNETYELENVKEMIVDDNYVFAVIKDDKIVRINKSDKSVIELKQKASNIIIGYENIFYLNKDDSKLYIADKDFKAHQIIVDDVKVRINNDSINGTSIMNYIDNHIVYIDKETSTINKVNLSTYDIANVVLYTKVKSIELVEDSLFYDLAEEKGLYLINLTTSFNAQITARGIVDFSVEK